MENRRGSWQDRFEEMLGKEGEKWKRKKQKWEGERGREEKRAEEGMDGRKRERVCKGSGSPAIVV